MKNMSFAMTTEQVRNQTKDVTRRFGWLDLKVGDQFQPVVKGMGLAKGEKVEKIGLPVTVVLVYREPIGAMRGDYGRRECIREGFPNLSPAEFVAMLCKSKRGATPESLVTRIQFKYSK